MSSPLTGIEKTAGYPYCRDVLNKMAEDNHAVLAPFFDAAVEKALAEARTKIQQDPDAYTALDQMDVEIGLQYRQHINDNKEELSNPPEHPIMWRQYRSRGGWCFIEDTPVTKLEPVYNGWLGANIIDNVATKVPIQTLYVGDYVLSSTREATDRTEYHTACWAAVSEIQAGVVWPDEHLEDITYRGSDGTDHKLQATPRHRFLASNGEERAEEWIRAEDIQVGTKLFTELSQNPVHVTGRGQTDSPEKGKNAWQRFFIAKPRVFNLSIPHTYTYYVGEEGGEVLVHNTK